jgi:hypothetical protein
LICINLNEFKLGFSIVGEICTQAHSYPKQATHQKSQLIELTCKSYTQDTLLLNFKITQKAFGFKPDSNNQSCRAKTSRVQQNWFDNFWNFLQIPMDFQSWLI